jgi:hypothetical protein
MALCICILAVVYLFQGVYAQNTAENKAENQLLQLYRILSSVAAPGGNGQRLILILPGKILNFNDYYPGNEYVNSLNTDDPEARRVEIPRRVMQNMFRLADIVPSVNPFASSDSGLSFSSMYRTILGQMTVRGIDSLSVNKRKAHMQAIEYLSGTVRDPLARNQEANRLTLYRKYRDLYNDLKLSNEKIIAERRAALPATQFEEWFTQNYPTLQSKLDGAYLEWLVFGRKDEVESKWLQLDNASPGLELLEAKSALRASGVSSLDRTQTVYPVYYHPSDWYKYINVTVLPMTREQIQQRIGELEGQRLLLIATQNIDSKDICFGTINSTRSKGEAQSSAIDVEITNSTQMLAEKRCKCVAEANLHPELPRSEITSCIEYENCLKDAQRIAQKKGASVSDLSELNDLLSADTDNRATNRVLNLIEDELGDLRALLTTASTTSSLASSLVTQNFVDPNDNWLSFEYSSQSESEEALQTSQYSAYSSSVKSYQSSASYSWWHQTGSYQGSSSSTSSSSSDSKGSSFNSLTKANLTVRGKILRVSIQRPWFRPDLFKNSRLGFVSCTQMVIV